MQDPVESERIAALERLEVLDTPSEPLFDSLTQLAALTFNTPIALISLEDQERQWFKARVGLDADHTARNISFCQHAILSDEVLVVCDALADPRFCGNPLVTGQPKIRFYAGAPLITPEGYRLGTLCIIDKAPRPFSDADASRLQAIANSVMQALILRLDSRMRERIAVVVDQQNKMLKLAEDVAGVGNWSWDVATDRTVWSEQVYRIHGFDLGVEPPALKGLLEQYHPDDAKTLADFVERAVTEGADYSLEARIYRPDGAERHVVARGTCRRAANGAISALVGTFQDITDHVSAERFIRTVTDNLPGIVGYWDNEMRCQFANATYSDWFDRAPESILGLTIPEVFGPQLFAEMEPYVRGALNGERQNFHRTFSKPSGEVSHFWTHYIPDTDDLGRTRGFCTLVSDITALKRVEDRLLETNALLEAALEKAEAAAAVKKEFLSNMSHEIRTPLTAIIGFTALLDGRNDLPDTARMMISRVKGAGSALLSIVNDILDFSKLKAGEMVVHPKPTDVVTLAEDAFAMFAPQAEAKSLWLEFEKTPEMPDHLLVDPDRLRQILFNLVGNAVKFTDQGQVRLRLAYDVLGQRLNAWVEDSGIGMDDTQRVALFQRFSQVDSSSTRRHGGTGLGLAICKGLAEAMGGEISVESWPGRGSIFHFNIHAPQASSALEREARPRAPGKLSGVRVLIGDPNAADREATLSLLQALDAEVTTTSEGAGVVALAADCPFDVILVDQQLPPLDGQGAIQRIRTEPGPNQDVPILAFTAEDDATVNCGPNGFDGVITKPIVASDMVSALVKATKWQAPITSREVNHAVGF